MEIIQNETQKSINRMSAEDTEIETFDIKKERISTKGKQNINRQGRVSRTQQISEKET